MAFPKDKPLIEIMKEYGYPLGTGVPTAGPLEEFTNAFVVDGAHTDASKAWIITYTGKKFYHLNPQPEMVDIQDIAHALSLTCRWTGHVKYHYSVAQHSWYCSFLVPKELALAALLHDASEAYLGDMNRPLKHFTGAGPEYLKVEAEVEKVIFKKFGLPFPIAPEVKEADTQMLYAEKAQLMNVTESTKYEARKWNQDEKAAPIQIKKWTPRRAERMFLARFAELTGEHNGNRRRTSQNNHV